MATIIFQEGVSSKNEADGSATVIETYNDELEIPSFVLDDADDLRIEGSVSASWKGVRSCSDQQRAIDGITVAFKEWLAKQLLAHRDLRYVTSGYVTPFTYYWSNSDHGSSGRSCRGWASTGAWVLFRKH